MKTYAYIAIALTLFLGITTFSPAWAAGGGCTPPKCECSNPAAFDDCDDERLGLKNGGPRVAPPANGGSIGGVPQFGGSMLSTRSPGAPPILPPGMIDGEDQDTRISKLIMHRANTPFTQDELRSLGAASPQEAEKNLAERKRQIILFLRTLENAVNAGVVPTEAQLEGILGRPSSDAAGQRKPGRGLRNALLAVLTAVWMKWDDITHGGQ